MQNKIFTDISAFLKTASPELEEKKIVFTNGCFDILHPGHLQYLEAARNKGDILIVGLNSDASVKRLKGENRPINPIAYRTQMLAGLASTNYVIVFEEDTPLQLIESLRPQVLVKGADYSLEEVVGAEFVQSLGGEVILIPLVGSYSTSKWIDALNKS